MPRRENCPGPERLQEWLAGALPEDQREALATHIEICAPCREEVERLLSATEVLGGLTPGAGDSGEFRGPALGPALDALKQTARPNPRDHDTTEHSPKGASTAVGSEHWGEPTRIQEPDRPSKSTVRIGPYQVIERVGRGGMGEVFRAMDPALDRVVAVKVLTPALAGSPEARRRFLREARAAAAVCHEHVVTIHAVDDSGEQPYLVMQYIAGDSLQQKIDRQGALGLKEILRIGMQVATGLSAAHGQGLVHRDIKPANILLENGVERVKITDFGLARAASDPGLTRPGMIVGTPNYMSPEQARGESVGPRSDLFSLGGVLYAMATGEPPFSADSAVAVLRKVSDDPPRPIRELNPEVPRWLVEIVDQLMSKRSEGRPSSAEEVAEQLRRHLADLQCSPTAKVEPSRRALARNAIRTTLALTLALGTVVAAGALAVHQGLWSTSPSVPRPPAAPPPIVPGPTPEQADVLIERGTEAALRDDHRAAVDLFSEGIRVDPSSLAARIGRGRAYGRLGDWPRALADLDQAIRQDLRNAIAFEERAYVRMRSGDFPAAVADANIALRLDPGRSYAVAHRGAALIGLGQWARARADFDAFIHEIPDEPWSHYHRSICRGKLGDSDGELADLDKAVALSPGQARFHYQRAMCLILRRELDKAMDAAETTIRLSPGQPIVLRLRGWVRVQTGDYAQALADYQSAFSDHPLDLVERADLASVEALAGEYSAAEEDFQEALKMDPNNAWVRGRRALYLYAAQGQHDRAISDCDEALKLDPGLAEASLNRGLSRLAKGDASGAVEDFNLALNPGQKYAITFKGLLSSRYAELHRARAEALERLGDPKAAMADREEADRLDRKSGEER